MKRVAMGIMVIALGLILLPVQGQSAETPKMGGKLVVGQDIDAVGLDPYRTTAFASQNYFEQVYNALLQFDEKGNLRPELALSWENPDPKQHIFRLRQGVKFHDGKEFGAEDVKATFDRMLDPKTASPRLGIFNLIDRVEVADKYTARFVLKEPFAPLLNYLASPAHSAILSKRVIEGVDPNKVMIGTGPFQMAEYRPNDTMLLKKNPQYWEKGLPYLDELEIRLIKDASSRVAALRAKSVDYIWIMEPQLVQILMKEKGIQSATAPATARKRLYFNCTKAPFNNVKVRQALSSATDRKELIRVAVMGKGELTGPIPPPAGEFASPAEKLPFQDYDPERAKRLLAEAGHPKGFKTTIKVSTAHVIDQYVAQLIQRQWQKVGVQIDIVQVEWGTLLKDAIERNYDLIHLTDIWRPDPAEYLYYEVDFKKRAGFNNPEIEALVLEGLKALDHKKRVAIYHEIEKKLAEASPILFLFVRPQRFEFWRDYVKGYIPTPQTSRVHFKNTWIDKQ